MLSEEKVDGSHTYLLRYNKSGWKREDPSVGNDFEERRKYPFLSNTLEYAVNLTRQAIFIYWFAMNLTRQVYYKLSYGDFEVCVNLLQDRI
ncbi:hypothetical protein AVEN_228718-1 [Araneus ventricosus]|uniref:Uncharacterized protein n=1 Tax=Araneus ventricosus TaxID=182803 RepID=A0A4Y2M8B0_ARAVE|nr:hypothetical protein AVEN_228718-1 [Araneus ventricosus]